jgi:cytidylate kinase
MGKKLIIINGPMGVGKSAVCRELGKHLSNSVWLDGDWCWMMNPFVVNEENKKMVQDNIVHLLKNFLSNSSYEHIIFSWVIPDENIYSVILDGLKGADFRVFKITLLCSEETLRKRIADDMSMGKRDTDTTFKSIEYLRSYANMDTNKIDTTNMSIIETAARIAEICTE